MYMQSSPHSMAWPVLIPWPGFFFTIHELVWGPEARCFNHYLHSGTCSAECGVYVCVYVYVCVCVCVLLLSTKTHKCMHIPVCAYCVDITQYDSFQSSPKRPFLQEAGLRREATRSETCLGLHHTVRGLKYTSRCMYW